MIHKELFSDQSRAVIHHAYRLASELSHPFVGSEHILWSISREENSPAANVLKESGLDHNLIRELIEKYGGGGDAKEGQSQGIAQDAERVFDLAEAQAKKLGHKKTDPEHLFLGILQEQECVAAKLIQSTGVALSRLTGEMLARLNKTWPRVNTLPAEKKQPKTKTLDKYSRDLTQIALSGGLDPVIGREEEVQRVIQILSRRTKNNPVLIGEPGVGKTAVAEGLAQRMMLGDLPENLSGRRIASLDMTAMLSGAKFRGDFEERIKSCIEEAAAAGNVILFIDELHTLIGAGAAEGAMDAANILKPALSRGEIQVIGATTLAEYRKHVEKDAALERRFQPITVEEPNQDLALQILEGLRERYEEHHKLTITDEALHYAVTLSSRYIQDRFLPDKAIDLVDEAASRVRTGNLTTPPHLKELEERIAALGEEKHTAVQGQDFELAAALRDRQMELRGQLEEERNTWRQNRARTVEAEDIAAVVSSWTGVPVTMLTQDESERLMKLEDILHQRLIGQEEAVTAVSKAIRRGRVGLKDPKRPIGAFLFLGPTGVGKTELCKALAEAMFQDENAMLRVDMSEYMERHTVSKLIGSPPGYVGYDEGGQLTERVRRKPYSVILFDEIEKAHEDVWSILLQIMEDGQLTDAQGRKVDFKNAIIVMTSNIGAKNITDKRQKLGFATSLQSSDETKPVEEIREKVMEDLKKTFKPEFLNRVDDIIVFHQLGRDHIRSIARIMLENLESRMGELGIHLLVEDDALDILAKEGFDPAFGARPLRRVIQTAIEDAAAELILDGSCKEGDLIRVTALDNKIHLEPQVTIQNETEAVPVG